MVASSAAAAQIDDFSSSCPCQPGIRHRLQATMDGLAVGDQRHVAAFACHGGLAQSGTASSTGRHFRRTWSSATGRCREKEPGFVADGGLEQALASAGCSTRMTAKARTMDEPGLDVVACAGRRRPNRRRSSPVTRGRKLSAGHVAQLAGAVDQLVHRVARGMARKAGR